MANAGGVWEKFSPAPLGPVMTIKDDLIAMVIEAEAEHDRTVQTELGPSELGNPCTYHLACRILGKPERLSDPWCRTIGIATHAWLEEAAAKYNIRHDEVRWYPERKVFPDSELLPVGGSSDLYDTKHRAVVDHKVVGRPQQAKYRNNGPGWQYRRQAHLYGLGYAMAGTPVDTVAIAFWLRGGRLPDLYVWAEPYDPAVAEEALSRYRTLRQLVLTLGEAVLDQLPRYPSECYDCMSDPEVDLTDHDL